MIDSQLAALFKASCMAELTAIKPGNVHIFADGHGMAVQDFIKSAEVTAAVIAQPGLSVGQRILSGVQATHHAVACNTNLGIVLLAAPLIQAAYSMRRPDPIGQPAQAGQQSAMPQISLKNHPEISFNSRSHALRAALLNELSALTVEDCTLAYAAIRLASPAGLGAADAHDVNAEAEVTLLQAMQAAQQRDMIARQYANGYEDIMLRGIPWYSDALANLQQPEWAVTAVYLHFLAYHKDSHIVRKFGEEAAEAVRQEAAKHLDNFMMQANPKRYFGELLSWDADLKARKLNPGTSADMTVASILAWSLLDSFNNPG